MAKHIISWSDSVLDIATNTFTARYPVTVLSMGVKGDKGEPGTGGAIVHSFAWGDATPQVLLSIPANKVIFKIELVLLNSFNIASSLTIGDSVDPTRLFNINGLDLTETGTYQSNPDYLYSTITPINLYLSLGGGVSSGNGLILIYIQE